LVPQGEEDSQQMRTYFSARERENKNSHTHTHTHTHTRFKRVDEREPKNEVVDLGREFKRVQENYYIPDKREKRERDTHASPSGFGEFTRWRKFVQL
jgi:hypothetical protein